jgi:hypothetical protein
MSDKLRPGVCVYRVVEIEPASEDAPHSWKVACGVIDAFSSKQIVLKAYLPGVDKKRFKPDAFGRVFFESPLTAIRHFLAAKQLEIEAIDRRRADNLRALAWARAQEGMS